MRPPVSGRRSSAPKAASALGRAPASRRQQPGEPGIARPVGGVDEQAAAPVQVQTGADGQAEAGLLRGDMHADGAGERVPVRDRDAGMAECGRRPHQFLGMRGTFEETEVRRDLQFGVGGHAKMPCTYHSGIRSGR